MNNKKDVKHLLKKLEAISLNDSGCMKLVDVRKSLQLSRRALGEILGLSQQTIKQYELGLRTPTFTVEQYKKLQLLLDEIGKTWGDLANDLSNPKPDENGS